jgi:Uma2 family endonuclease
MVTQARLLTAEEFIAYAQRPEHTELRLELLEGAISDMPPSSAENSSVAGKFFALLWQFLRVNKLGFVTGADGGYQLSATTVVMPDAAFISKARLATLKGVGVVPLAPDLAIEVISPSETANEVSAKTRAYVRAGTALVWRVYVTSRSVEVCRLDADGNIITTTYTDEATLSGEPVLPGLRIALTDVFDELE